MQELLFPLIMIPFLIESWIFFKRPTWLARLAFIPLSPRRTIDAGAALIEASTEAVGGYRDAAIAKADTRKLAWPRHIETSDATGGYDEAGDFAWIHQNQNFFSKKPRAIARIDASTDGQKVELSARWTPYPLFFFVLFPLFFLFFLGHLPSLGEALFIGFFFMVVGLGGNLAWSRYSIKRQTEEALDVIERSMEEAIRRAR